MKGDPKISERYPINRIKDPDKKYAHKGIQTLKGSKAEELTVNFDLVVGVRLRIPKMIQRASEIQNIKRTKTEFALKYPLN